MSEIETFDCSWEELPEIEREWQINGYSLSAKNSEKDLLPREYFKRGYSGNEAEFSGPSRWTLIR